MEREDIIRMAREVGWPDWEIVGMKGELKHFAQLVSEVERQEILKMCEPPEHSHQFVHTFKKLIAARGSK